MKKDLYGDQILEWAERSEHMGAVENPDYEATATNPLCGDRVTVQVRMDGNLIKDLCCRVRGCLLCKASCALLAHMAGDLDRADLKDLRDRFEQFLRADDDTMVLPTHEMFSPVRSHKSRYRCVLLPYDTALKALGDSDKSPHR